MQKIALLLSLVSLPALTACTSAPKPDISSSNAPAAAALMTAQNNTSTPMTVLDSNGSPAFLVRDNPAGTGGTYVGLWPGRASNYQNAEFYCLSSNPDCSISFRGKGSWFFAFHASAQRAAEVRFYEQETNGNNAIGLMAPASVANTITFTLPAVPGQPGQKLCTQDGYTLTWCN